MDNQGLLTHPLGPAKSTTPPFPLGAQRILLAKGNTSREKHWWKTGTDKLASHGLDTEVWVGINCHAPDDRKLDLEGFLNTESLKDLPEMRSDGVEDSYWTGTELSLIGIPHFPGVVYATDGSHSTKGMGAGFYRQYIKGGVCCKVGGGSGTGSSGRAEFAAACLALEDSLTHDNPIAPLTDAKGLMAVASNWVDEGKDPLLLHSPDGDILGRIIRLLQSRVERSLFTIFVKIRAHRGEFLNEKADRCAGEGRDHEDNLRWEEPSLRPIFCWTSESIEHRCPLNKTLSIRVHKSVAQLQMALHDNFTFRFLIRENNSRELLGAYWQDKTINDRCKRRLLQSIGNSKARQQTRSLTVSKTLALSDIILKLFHTSILRSPEWALSSLPIEISNTRTARLFLFKKITGPFHGLLL